MKPVECPFEADVLAAVQEAQWPERVDASLVAHAASCPICADVAAVAGMIGAAKTEMFSQTTLPDAGGVWWRAQLRARREAARTAGRPITAVQVLAFACAMGLLGACFGATSAWFQTALHWAGQQVVSLDWKEHGLVIGAMGALVLVVPTALYFVMGRD